MVGAWGFLGCITLLIPAAKKGTRPPFSFAASSCAGAVSVAALCWQQQDRHSTLVSCVVVACLPLSVSTHTHTHTYLNTCKCVLLHTVFAAWAGRQAIKLSCTSWMPPPPAIIRHEVSPCRGAAVSAQALHAAAPWTPKKDPPKRKLPQELTGRPQEACCHTPQTHSRRPSPTHCRPAGHSSSTMCRQQGNTQGHAATGVRRVSV